MLGDDKNKPTDPNYPDNERSTYLSPTYGRGNFTFPAPSDTIPEDSSTPRATLRLILDEIDLDAPNSSDLGSYICDYMDPEADELIRRTIGKVFIDQSEYPKTAEIGHRVAKMIQRWYHGTGEPTMTGEHRKILGTVTIGSSEAIMMALIAHRHNWMVKWEERRGDPVTLPGAAGLDRYNYFRRDKPFGLWARDVHTCWGKYSKYFNTNELVLDLDEENTLIQPDQVWLVINSTIWDLLNSVTPQFQVMGQQIIIECGYDVNNQADKEILQHKKAGELIYTVGCVVGTTFTGEADPVEEINGVLRDFTRVPLAGPDFTYYADVPIHVDAASGGFVMPFTAPNTKWDFQLEHVQSINVSNHKFGLVYPGCGTVVFRDADVVASELIYNISYLGGSFTDYTLNFSRGSAMVLASYYNLVRLGLKGYAEVNTNCVKHAQYLRKVIEEGPVTGKMFEVISDTDILPMVVWRDKRPTEEKDKWDLSELSNELLTYRWSLPAYKLPFTSSEDPDGPLVMRVVTRQDVSTEKVNDLYESILKSIATLDARWGDADLTDPNVQAVKDRVRTAATRTGTMD